MDRIRKGALDHKPQGMASGPPGGNYMAPQVRRYGQRLPSRMLPVSPRAQAPIKKLPLTPDVVSKAQRLPYYPGRNPNYLKQLGEFLKNRKIVRY